MLSIRTQDRMAVVPYDKQISIWNNKTIMIGNSNEYDDLHLLGAYATEERALQVLDEIMNAIYRNKIVYDHYVNNEYGYYKEYSAVGLAVYQMPKE